MLIFLNGQFVPEERAVVSVFDRGFLYGDGLFEAILIFNGKLFRWGQHVERLRRGCEFLKITLPFSPEALRGFADELITKNQMPDALLRLTISRGAGARGYSPRGAEKPTIVMSLHARPESGVPIPRWKLLTSSYRLPANDPLSQFKTANKLPKVMARAEADAAGADEALLRNTDDFVVEGTSCNLFWINHDTICTPPVTAGILPGVTRGVVLELCQTLKLRVTETTIRAEELKQAGGVFVSLTSRGIVEVASLDGKPMKFSPLFAKIHESYRNLLVSS